MIAKFVLTWSTLQSVVVYTALIVLFSDHFLMARFNEFLFTKNVEITFLCA